MFATIPSVIAHIKAGNLVAIAVTSKARSRSLPETPTVAESGFPGFDMVSWQALVATIEPLLRPVVQVPLQPATLGVGGGHDPAAGVQHLGQLRPDLGGQPLVLQRQPGRRGDRLQDTRVLPQSRVVHQHGDPPAVPLHHRDGPRRVRRRQRERPAVAVDMGLRLRPPVAHLQRRVPQRPPQHGAQLRRRQWLPQLGQQRPDSGPAQPHAHQPGQEPQRQQAERHRVHPPAGQPPRVGATEGPGQGGGEPADQAGQRHRREHPPHRPAGAHPPADQHGHHPGGHGRRDDLDRPRQRQGQLRAGCDQQHVRPRQQPPPGVVEQRPDRHEHEHAGIRRGDEHALQPRGEPPARERQHQVGEEPAGRPGEQHADAVHPAGAGQLQVLGEEPGAGQNHEQPDPVRRLAGVCRHPGAEEEEAADPADDRVGRRVVALPRLERQTGHPEHHPEPGGHVRHLRRRAVGQGTPSTGPGDRDRCRLVPAHTPRLTAAAGDCPGPACPP